MDVADKLKALERKRILLTAAGGMGTLLYLCLLGWWAKWSDLPGMSLNNIGDFLAGAFAPLAFLWLVIGYFLQAIELKQNSESLMQQSEEMKNSVGASRMNVLNQSIEVFRYELSRICHDLNMIKCGEQYIINSESFWRQYMDGNVNIFAKKLIARKEVMSLQIPLSIIGEEDIVYDRYKKFAFAYVSLFSKFMHDLSLLDESGVFAEVFKASPFSEVREILASGLKVLNKGQE